MMRVRLLNFSFVNGGVEADVEQIDDQQPNPNPDPNPNPNPGNALPPGYDYDEGVGYSMLMRAVVEHNLDAVAMQNHGKDICKALNQTWPGLNAYAHPHSDAVMWPGFGSLDVTVDSGKGGWYFNPDHQAPYDPNEYRRQNS